MENELKVEYVEDIKTEYKIIATTIKLEEMKQTKQNRAERKRDLEKITREYLDR